ncbi:MAG: sulfatase modifying factor 1 [Verrucomicrobiales bacterium]|jgi:sulfatase modifying factor 1
MKRLSGEIPPGNYMKHMKHMKHMKLLLFPALLGLLALPASAGTVSFGTFSIDFVDVGDPGNADDGTGYGGVPYDYQIAVHEVSESMITAANTAESLGLTQDARGVDKPSTSISWNEGARFVNWLNTSNGFQPAYNFATQPGGGGYDPNENLALWGSGDAWQLGGENLFRHKDAHYFLPSEDEWYKAAYYDGNTSTYFDYATGSDTAPAQTFGGTVAGTAVYWPLAELNSPPGPADITNAGGLSPYGTMAQNGNVWEWAESGFNAPNDSAAESRVLRGGFWGDTSFSLRSSNSAASLRRTRTAPSDFVLQLFLSPPHYG